MNKDKAIELLENLLSTSNIFKEETEEAIEYAIKNLKTNENHIIEIDPNEISIVIDYLKSFSINPTYPRITKFLLGNKLKEEGISSHSLYGKYMGKYRRGELTDFVVSIIKEKKASIGKSNNYNTAPWTDVQFFSEDKFNKLSDKAINQLIEKIEEIGLVNSDNLTAKTIEYRKINPRYREPWSEKEINFLETALKYTNDLNLLSKCFGRTIKSIEVQGKKIIYQNQTSKP